MANIELKNIVKIYNREKILNNINLRIGDGEFMALVGPSGCGKTTTLKIIAGLIYPEEGQIYLNRQNITNLPAEKRNIVMVFQDYLLFPHLTVRENISFGLKMLGYSLNYRKNKARELLELVQLPGLENRYPTQLSGGQKQRVALARALALEPEVLLLDEPLSNLDPRLREDMRGLIEKLHRQLKMTTIVVTHDQNEAMLLADRIAVMFDGEVAQFSTPYDLYNKPVSKEVANLFGACNYLQGYVENGTFFYHQMEFAVPHVGMEGEIEAFVRAEHIELVEAGESSLTGVIREKRYTGGQSLFKIITENGELLCQVKNHINIVQGEKVGVKIDWPRVWFRKRDVDL